MLDITKKALPWALILGGIALFILSFGPILLPELWYFFKLKNGGQFSVEVENRENALKKKSHSVFAKFLSTEPIVETPDNYDFNLIIEKIGVNAPVVPNVSVTNNDAYIEALHNGVAHAINSDKPSKDPGNTYIFAHASLNFWELGKFATTFNLLRKLEIGDTVKVLYKNTLYQYKVVNIEYKEGWDTNPISRTVIEPVLTLQTCDPPGTTLNRLIVTATLISTTNIYE